MTTKGRLDVVLDGGLLWYSKVSDLAFLLTKNPRLVSHAPPRPVPLSPRPTRRAGRVRAEGGQPHHPRQGVGELRLRGVPLDRGDDGPAKPQQHPLPGTGARAAVLGVLG